MASLMPRLSFLLFSLLPTVAFAYSDDYCASLTRATADAIDARNWNQLIKVASDKERNCAKYITVEDLGDSINLQAIASLELGNPQNALDSANRCIRITNIAQCHLSKGRALFRLSRSREGTEEIRLSKKLADQEISRLKVEVQRASTSHERRLLESSLRMHEAMADFAIRILGEREQRPEFPRADTKRESGTTGSGILVNPAGDVLTNHHVIEGCKTVRAVDSSNKRSVAKVIATDPLTDLAVVRIQSSVNNTAVFRSGPSPQVGESVVVVGFPLTGLLASGANVAFGHIGALAGLGNDATKLQISAPVQPGNSGGPLLDQSGLVIGVVVQKLDAVKVARLIGDIPQNINFAVKGDVAQRFLSSRGIPFSTAVSGSVFEGTEIANRGRAIAVLVECER